MILFKTLVTKNTYQYVTSDWYLHVWYKNKWYKVRSMHMYVL